MATWLQSFKRTGSRFLVLLPRQSKWAGLPPLRSRAISAERLARCFVYHDKGSLATIGRSSAIADVKGFKVSGYVAWLTWLFVHVLFLIGFRNRIQVLWEWFWDYVTFQRGARLITGQSRSIVPLEPGVIHEQCVTEAEAETRKAS